MITQNPAILAAFILCVGHAVGQIAVGSVEEKFDFPAFLKRNVTSTKEVERFAAADAFRSFDSCTGQLAEWKFTKEISLLMTDQSERVRTQALIGLSACAAFIPREEAIGIAKQLQFAIDSPKNDVSVEETSTTCLALEALYTDNVIIPPSRADRFEQEEFSRVLTRLAEENLENNERLQWIFFMMFRELRNNNNAFKFVRRIRQHALSGDPTLFSDTYAFMQEQEFSNPILWRRWIRQLASHQEKLSELERIVESRKKDLDLSELPITNEKVISVNNCIFYLKCARDDIRLFEQGGADQPATAPESKPEGLEKPKPESEVRPQ